MKQAIIIYLSLASLPCLAQDGWTARQCMQYAVEHNHEVRQAELELDNCKAARTGAIGRFLPSVEAGIGAQYNFGRAIDPETNVYTDVSTFYNSYSAYASLPVFDGFSRLHALKAAKASVLMGRASLRQRQDQTALAALQAFASVAYYKGMVDMAREKVEETRLLLRQTQVMEEVGRKSAADVAGVESQRAEADYELTRQQGLYASALLELKKSMAFPMSDSLDIIASVDGNVDVPFRHELCERHPELQVALYQMQASKNEWHQARSSLFPSLSLGAGLNTTYYHALHTPSANGFSNQFKNNMGEYIGATLSIPLFSQLQTVTSIRRAKNRYLIAREAYEQKQLELEKLSREAMNDLLSYQKQTIQMTHKVEADSMAYGLTRRQFEEGLATAIDLRNTSAQLLQSKATLLQCQLMTMVKVLLTRYYRGECIWE